MDTNTAPALFIGHGSPMNAIEDNAFTRAWRALAPRLGRPRAIAAISAHWETDGAAATGDERPRTIHDFRGFPPALHAVEYPAPGAPALAADIAARLGGRVDRGGWGLDHGVWSVLLHLFPAVDVPVVQVSLDRRLTPQGHFEAGRKLRELRREGVMVLGSGDIVHNLRTLNWNDPAPPAWALAYDARITEAIRRGDHATVLDWRSLPDAERAAPDPEHFQPLLHVLGAAFEAEASEILDFGHFSTVSMTSVGFGLAA